MTFFSPDRLARKSANHPWLTLGIWLLVIAGAIGAGVPSHATMKAIPKNAAVVPMARGKECRFMGRTLHELAFQRSD